MGLLKNWWIKLLSLFENEEKEEPRYLTSPMFSMLEEVSLKINEVGFNPYKSPIGSHYTDLRHEDIYTLYRDTYWAFTNLKQRGYLPSKYHLTLSPRERQVLDYLTLEHEKDEYTNPKPTINSSISIWNDFLVWVEQVKHEDRVLIEDSIKTYIEEWLSVYAIILSV